MVNVVRIAPPDFLMEPTPEPECNATTNGDLLNCANDRLDALRRANADKAAIKKAVEE